MYVGALDHCNRINVFKKSEETKTDSLLSTIYNLINPIFHEIILNLFIRFDCKFYNKNYKATEKLALE